MDNSTRAEEAPVPTPLIPAEKPGYATTEFWVSILSVAAILVKVFGIDVSTDDVNALAVSIAGTIAGLLAVWGIVSRYIKSRSEVKSAAFQAEGIKQLGYTGSPVTLHFGGK